MDGQVKIIAGHQSACGDATTMPRSIAESSPAVGRPRYRRQRPTGGEQRAIGFVVHFLSVENGVRPQTMQPVVMFSFPGDGLDFVPQFCENRDRDRTDAACSSGDDDRPAFWSDAARESPKRTGRR